MQTKTVNGLLLNFYPADADSADLVADACRATLRLLREGFALDPPADCRVYIMTSWAQFMFLAPPWPWKILLLVSFPLWGFRTMRMWPFVGGWEQRFGRRHTVGVKPPRLLAVSDRSIGMQIFREEKDLREKVRQVTCHELTHAVIDELNLPTWLKEGLPMLATDRMAGKPTVQPDSLRWLETSTGGKGRGQERIRIRNREAAVRLYTRGYWLTRFLEDTRPGLVKELLQERLGKAELEKRIAAAFDKSPDNFWNEVNGEVISHFRRRGNPARGGVY